jgi:very-short-patch-repair endonuclease
MSGLETNAGQILRTMKEQRFRRQVPVDEYILDFYSPRYKLCVEIDGPLHEVVRDAIRDRRLAERGVRTLRFDEDAIGSMERIIEETCETLRPRFKQSERSQSRPVE